MAKIAAFRHPEPMSAINVTPFIDVLLVLLIMLILTIPMTTHKLPVDLPTPVVGDAPLEKPHQLAIAQNGQLSWDGRTIGDAELPGLLSAMQAGATPPPLHMRTDAEARYERFDQILAVVKRAGVERLGFIGDKAFATAF